MSENTAVYDNNSTNIISEENNNTEENEEDNLLKQERREKTLPKESTHDEDFKRKRLEKRVLSTLDILISLSIVTPLVVAGWRGLWELMDMYFYYFPIWESFWIAIFAHLMLALAQESFHTVLIESKNNWTMRIVSFTLAKFYTFVFTIITNMHWRGGWAILDDWFSVEIGPSGAPTWESCVDMVFFCGGCFIILFAMKCLFNLVSPPFLICIDHGSDMFLFPTMFKTKAICIIIAAFNRKVVMISEKDHKTNHTSAVSEKLSSPRSSVHFFRKAIPHPFQTTLVGPAPEQFKTTTTSTTSTSKIPNLTYPQLNRYRNNNYYPKNIQDIIGYITNKKYSEDSNTNKSENHPESSYSTQVSRYQASNAEEIKHKSSTGFTSGLKQDPFFYHKPTESSDVNLLATASFRFAPPVWKNDNYYSKNPHQSKNVLQKPLPTVQPLENVQSSLEKPLSVTLNIFPMDFEIRRDQQSLLRHFLKSSVLDGYANDNSGRKIRSDNEPVTINLRVFASNSIGKYK